MQTDIAAEINSLQHKRWFTEKNSYQWITKTKNKTNGFKVSKQLTCVRLLHGVRPLWQRCEEGATNELWSHSSTAPMLLSLLHCDLSLHLCRQATSGATVKIIGNYALEKDFVNSEIVFYRPLLNNRELHDVDVISIMSIVDFVYHIDLS